MIPTGAPDRYAVGTPEAAEALLQDLYVNLRQTLRRWASVTMQTPQPRMGYVGQHLVSVITGYPGGRSGARGDDLKLPDGNTGEIKCCYRVDQLGSCNECGTVVASIEKVCPNKNCNSRNLQRKDDSKWLLPVKTEAELQEAFTPLYYYFVLFEFENLASATAVNVQVSRVDSSAIGFRLCLIDYFFNIRSKSKSKAPFNLWPASLKFVMMKPHLIYEARILEDDSIQTSVFPGREPARLQSVDCLQYYSRSTTLTVSSACALAEHFSVSLKKQSKARTLTFLESVRVAQGWSDSDLADVLAARIYMPRLADYRTWVDQFAPDAFLFGG